MSVTARAARHLAALAAVVALPGSTLAAQGSKSAAAPTFPNAPEVGQPAPEFTAPGATRYGLLASPVRLSDFRGKTVVLAFFYKARTKG